jgi:hypothetical protein
VDELDRRLRNTTYQLFIDLGHAPTATEVGERAGLADEEVLAGWRRLHDAHALVLDLESSELRMANPFSAVPTPYRVTTAGRTWYANCAWDAFGILAALHSDGRIESSCPDCGDEITVHVEGEVPLEKDLVFHCLVPAALWWSDIGFS